MIDERRTDGMRGTGFIGCGLLMAALLAPATGCSSGGSGRKAGPPPGSAGITARSEASGEVSVEWTLDGQAAAYNLYWSTSPGVDPQTASLIPSVVPPYIHTGLANGQTYHYAYTPLVGAGEGKLSREARAMPLDPPAITSILSGTSRVTLEWAPVTGAEEYTIYWAPTPGVSRASGLAVPGVTSPYTHTGLGNGAPVHYVVTATNTVGGGAESSESPEASATPLAPPSGVIATPAMGEVSVTWNPVAGASAYDLYWSTSPGVTRGTGTKVTGVTRPHLHAGLVDGTTYRYVVVARNATGESDLSAEVAATPGRIPGDLDWVFVHDGAAGADNDDVARGIIVDPSGRILVAGYSNYGWMAVWRLLDTGALDTSFDGQGFATFRNSAGDVGPERGHDIALDAAGRILVTGYADAPSGADAMVLWRLDDTGALDPTFGTGGIVIHDDAAGGGGDDGGNALLVEASGRILVTGYSRGTANNDDDMVLWAFDGSGALDPSLAGTGFLTIHNAGGTGRHDVGEDIVVDPSGRILVAGWSSLGLTFHFQTVVWRFDSAGVLDPSFATGGEFVAIGTAGWNPSEQAFGLSLDPGGRIYVTGHVSSPASPQYELVTYALDSSGALDAGFGTGGYVTHSGAAGGSFDVGAKTRVDGAGRLLIGGYSGSSNVDNDMAIWRYTDTGDHDTTFGTVGYVTHHDAAGGDWHDVGFDITLDAAGRLLVAGYSINNVSGGNADMVVWRFHP